MDKEKVLKRYIAYVISELYVPDDTDTNWSGPVAYFEKSAFIVTKPIGKDITIFGDFNRHLDDVFGTNYIKSDGGIPLHWYKQDSLIKEAYDKRTNFK